ncbi:MAG: putative lipid II flippase FtsW [Candidatus Brocadiaceae bacterium]|nr:putative lipid II flippase FtsW [Candidatus Brocadiaceae bacterium]
MRLPEPGGVVVGLTGCLLGIGIVMVYSSDWVSSLGQGGDSSALLKHMVALGLGTGAMVGLLCFDYRRLESLWYVWLALALSGLVLVLVPGIGTLQNGARRWIRLGPMMGFQPSEFAKLVLVIFMARWASKYQGRMREFLRGFLFPLLAVMGFTVLTVLEPDFGTAGFMAVLGMMLLIAAGSRWVYVGAAALSLVPVLFFLIHHAAYRKARVLAFMDPWSDASGAGYHIIQSWIALGSGGSLGDGLGKGYQKLFFLPECSGDFIFATLGEELGFAGTFSVVLLFALLAWQGLRVSLRAPETFGQILALGLTFMLCYQAAFNMAVVLGCVPTKGIPLPFISSGGSSLLLSMAAVGLLLNISIHSQEKEGVFSWRPGFLMRKSAGACVPCTSKVQGVMRGTPGWQGHPYQRRGIS